MKQLNVFSVTRNLDCYETIFDNFHIGGSYETKFPHMVQKKEMYETITYFAHISTFKIVLFLSFFFSNYPT